MRFKSLMGIWVMVLLCLAGVARADTVNVDGVVSAEQTGVPTITLMPDGNFLWVTPVDFTNTGATTLFNVTFVQNVTDLQPINQVEQKALFDDAAGLWRLGSDISKPANGDDYVLAGSVPITLPPGFGTTPASHLPFFVIGNLAPGQTISRNLNMEVSPDVETMSFGGSIVAATTPAPLPTTAIAGFALLTCLAGAAVVRRKLATV